MLLKFTGKSMSKYAGIDGLGNTIRLNINDITEVSETVGKLLLQKYSSNFEVIIKEDKPEHAPKVDKFFRKKKKVKTK